MRFGRQQLLTELQNIVKRRKLGDLGDSGGRSKAAAADRVTEFRQKGGNQEIKEIQEAAAGSSF